MSVKHASALPTRNPSKDKFELRTQQLVFYRWEKNGKAISYLKCFSVRPLRDCLRKKKEKVKITPKSSSCKVELLSFNPSEYSTAKEIRRSHGPSKQSSNVCVPSTSEEKKSAASSDKAIIPALIPKRKSSTYFSAQDDVSSLEEAKLKQDKSAGNSILSGQKSSPVCGLSAKDQAESRLKARKLLKDTITALGDVAECIDINKKGIDAAFVGDEDSCQIADAMEELDCMMDLLETLLKKEV